MLESLCHNVHFPIYMNYWKLYVSQSITM